MYGETRQNDSDIVGWDRFLIEVVKEFTQENEIKLDLLSAGWIMRLQKGDNLRFIFGLDLGLNNSTSKLLARDKAATSDILELSGVPHITHKLFLRPTSLGSNPEGNWSKIKEFFKENDNDVVCKPNLGSSGMGVEHTQNQAALEHTVQEIFAKHRTMALCPYVEMSAEYRVTVLDGKVELIYKKVKENKEDLKFNLCKGAYAEEVKEEEREKISNLAVDAAGAISIRFANVDIAESKSGLKVLEINSGVMFEHYARQGDKERIAARSVYRKALAKLFN